MLVVLLLLGALVSGCELAADTGANQSIVYSSTSIVNAADNQPGVLSPNVIGTIYGTGLAYTTRAIAPSDISGGVLPTVLPGTGVHVICGGLMANIYYVSPTQINFLVPSMLVPGTVNIQVVLDALPGPLAPVQLAAATPALFQMDPQNAVATRADGTLLTPDAAAHPGEIVVLYATGLGKTIPALIYAQIPTAAATLARIADFQILLDGALVDPSAVLYAGITPGLAGLYQVNFRVPASIGPNPEIRIGFPDAMSRAGIQLPVSP